MDIKITINLSQDTIGALKELVNELRTPAPLAVQTVEPKAEEPKQAPKKAAPKKEAPATKQEETKPAEDKAPTKDDVVKALKALADKKDNGVAKEVLKAFGAAKLSELKEEDYAAAIAKAEEALNA